MYIAIEGVDGTGKTTQIELLKKHYKEAIFTKEPGYSEFGKRIREILLYDQDFNLNERTKFLLFLADRSEHLEKYIIPKIKTNKLILSDRSLISGLSYFNDPEFDNSDSLIEFNKFACFNHLPQKLIILEATQDIIQARLRQRKQTIDNIESTNSVRILDIQKHMISYSQKLNIETLIINSDQDRMLILKKIISWIDDKLN